MVTLHADRALLPEGWRKNVRLTIEETRLSSVEADVEAEAADERHELLLPAMPNLHSHAFQRAMAGLTEKRGPGEDSFWSWRTLMYKFALSMTPDQMEVVATQLYMEMLEAGLSRVGEFHYLHHDKDGRHYANIAEMAERIASASAEAGIALTLLPVFYAHSGFGGAEPIEGQRRFIHSPEAFAALMELCEKLTAVLPGARLGVAPHSLRAVTPEELASIVRMTDGPVHIHVAEQVREVEDCLAWSDARPVEWLLANMPVNERWCLIHATHMSEQETRGVAKSGAIAGLCPITEANLGDGMFNGAAFLGESGRFGIGSDSNVLISVPGELRQLEYSQRLASRARNVMARPEGSTGALLFEQALLGGSLALGAPAGLAEGNFADIVSLDLGEVPYLSPAQILDHWIFAGGVAVDCVWALGRKQVENGRHIRRDAISRRFRATMKELLSL
ncbi:formimidoylglutamate deiminase [Rhizobium sp. LC145]|uniref:formimidoylglutamate deiminase n=1 Tax=Rhizobium sp. LC145 TaxID=1120688 RepID=UPI00062A46D2|nr:formimidoylglutamate deiminase [Rhizobium sp. LC145]KKX33225.1 N-formimino-L-glutamate deiminase [Rhizobium sp. LC145]TKT68613.1 formimidoylglutamate deiminase [Rhizobiaceae bacterium LC148]